MKPSILLLVTLAFALSGCATRNDNGCDSVACRPLSDSHHLIIWWPNDMRNGVQDYTQMPVR